MDWRLEDPNEDVTGQGHLRQEEQSDMDGETGRESEEVMTGMGGRGGEGKTSMDGRLATGDSSVTPLTQLFPGWTGSKGMGGMHFSEGLWVGGDMHALVCSILVGHYLCA